MEIHTPAEQAIVLSEDPMTIVHDDVVTSEECAHFIEVAHQTGLQRALVAAREKGQVSNGRTGSNTWVAHDHDATVAAVAKRIAALVDMPLENAEKFQIIHYGPGQEYRRHYDSWIHNGSEATLRCMRMGGARTLTALCYLNTVQEGGGTHMVSLDKVVDAKEGRLLVFRNTLEDNHTRHPKSEHAGMPVIAGEKYAFNLWFREGRRDTLYADINPAYYSDAEVGHRDPLLPTRLSPEKHIYHLPEVVSCTEAARLRTTKMRPAPAQRPSNYRPSAWVSQSEFPRLIEVLSATSRLDRRCFEKLHIVEYAPNSCHGRHHVALDSSTEAHVPILETKGQRVLCASVPLTPGFEFCFPKIGLTIGEVAECDGILHWTCEDGSCVRDPDVECSIRNTTTQEPGYLLRAYARVSVSDEDLGRKGRQPCG